MSSDEDSVAKLEELLRKIIEKLESIENRLKFIGHDSNELMTASEIFSLLSTPIEVAVDAARRFLYVARDYKLDPISLDIVKILSVCEGYSVSGITRRLRDLRGSASRRIVRERLRVLEDRGIVVNKGSSTRPLYVLRRCIEDPKRLT